LIGPVDAPSPILDRAGYELVVEDDFDTPDLDRRLWLPHYLPHWSSSAATAARYSIADSVLTLRIDRWQQPWSPEFDGRTKVSSLQTGVFSGPTGSNIGQLPFRPGLVVREAQPPTALYTPHGGLFEARLRFPTDPANMAALWMIGFGDDPARTGEICIAEVFGSEIGPRSTLVGMGLHPFADPEILDDFTKEAVAIDAAEFHAYAAEWTPSFVAFYLDERLVRFVAQSPAYPMQLMLGIYEFADGPEPPSPADRYPKEFLVDWFRGYRHRG
jgi:Glycosyl hydrolases family 16